MTPKRGATRCTEVPSASRSCLHAASTAPPYSSRTSLLTAAGKHSPSELALVRSCTPFWHVHQSGLIGRQPQPFTEDGAVLADEAWRVSFSVLTCKPMFQSHQNPALQANLQATMRGQHLPQQGRQRPVKQKPPWHTCTCSVAVRSAAQMLEATTDGCRACWCSCPG